MDNTIVESANPVTPEMRVDGKIAVVTGASRGLGRACAFALAGIGAEVTLIGRVEETLESVAAEIAASGGAAHPLVCDVTDISQIEQKIGGIEHIDILINNAGTNVPEPFIDVSEENYDLIMGLNVKSAVFVAQTVVHKMISQESGGTIINMSSQMGHVGLPGRTIYCTSKHAIEGLTKAMGVELDQIILGLMPSAQPLS